MNCIFNYNENETSMAAPFKVNNVDICVNGIEK